MFRPLLPVAICLLGVSAIAFAQNVTCADRPKGDKTNACANTRFVIDNAGGGSGGITINTTTITGGTSKGILFNNAGTVGNTGTANSSLLVTDGSGNPSLGTALPSGTTATTQAPGTNNTTVATTAFVQTAVGGGISISEYLMTNAGAF